MSDRRTRRTGTTGAALTGVLALTVGMSPTACVDLSGPLRPPSSGDLTATASADRPELTQRDSVTLSVVADGGMPPYVFRWDQNGGPEDIDPSAETGASTTAGPFETPGRYVYRVIATDSNGLAATDFVIVNVSPGAQVKLTTSAVDVLEGSSVEITATVTQGVEPFSFTWSLDDGPVELDLADAVDATLITPPLSSTGDYVFRVTVEDAVGFTASDTLTVPALSALSVDAPRLVFVGEPAGLSAVLNPEINSPSFSWTVTQGSATFDDATAGDPALTVEIGETLLVELNVAFENETGQSAVLTREVEIVAAASHTPRMLIRTGSGDITLELNADAAPLTTANFLAYVDDGFYDGVLFHRNACTNNPDTGECDLFVLQGGGFVREDDELVEKEPTRDPVPGESGNGLTSDVLYSVAMALSGGDADSADTEFFVNLADNGFLDDQGFTVFGSIVEGRDVVDAIANAERTDSPIIPGEVSLPVEDVIMEQVTRVAP